MTKNPNLFKRLLGTALALAVFPVAGMAAPTNHETLPLLTSSTTNKTGQYTFSNIAAFNNSLGTLIAVDLTLTLYSTSYVTVYNSNMEPETYVKAHSRTSGSTTLTYATETGPGTISINSAINTAGPFAGSVGAEATTPERSGATSSASSSFTIDDPGSFYSGAAGKTYSLSATFKENAGLFGGMVTSGDPGVYFGGGDNMYETLSIEYFYCNCMSVPEPSTVPLVALSLGALFFGRRFLVKKAKLA